MGLKDCVDQGLASGIFTLEESLALKRRYDQLAREILSPAEVRARMIAEVGAEAVEQRRRALLAETKRIGLMQAIMGYRNRKGQAAPHEALWRLIEHFGYMGSQADMQTRMETIIASAHEKMESLLHAFRKGAFSGELRRKGAELTARMDNIVRELFGTNTGDAAAKGFAEAWSQVAEWLRLRFNEAGGAIRKLEKWGLPQAHDAAEMLKQGKEKWIAYITPLLDRERMINHLTGIRMTDAEMADSLSHVYDTITTDGWSNRDPSTQPVGRSALYKRHADHRFLHFKDAESWLQYQKTFGEADVYAAMMGHISYMSRDIAAMEVMGPNPEVMFKYLKQEIEKSMGERSDAVNKGFHKADEMWAHFRGSANMPVSSKVANTLAGARSAISSMSLGSAAISALSDHATDAVTRAFVGLPILKAFTGWVKQLGPNAQRHAVRSRLIMDSALHAVHQYGRHIGSISARTWAGYINDRVLTGSGLVAMTQARKHAFGLDFQAHAADVSRFTWDELANQGRAGAAFRRTLERHGFDAASWDAIRDVNHYRPDIGEGHVAPRGQEGEGFLRPQEIENGATLPPEAANWDDVQKAAWRRDIAARYNAMILRETRYAVVESTIAGRAAMVGTNQPGTFVGELLHSAGQFKAFGATFMMMHGERIFRELSAGNIARGAVYFGALLIAMTLMGAISLQLKEIANGRDPRRMDMTKYGAKFWGAALLQGGGLGIYGDFMFSDVNRQGGSLAGTLMGPMVDKIDNIRRLTTGNLLQLSTQDRTNFGRELSHFLRTNMPGSTLWYAREAWNRVLMDQLQYLMDPDAHGSFRRQIQARRRDYRQQFWWAPGEQAPRREPDLGAMWPTY